MTDAAATRAAWAQAVEPAWLAEVPVRPLVETGLEATFPLLPGDRPLAAAGATVAPGDPLLEHLKDRRVDEVAIAPGGPSIDGADVAPDGPVAGRAWVASATQAGGRHGPEGELLAALPGQPDRWRIVTGDQRETVLSPVGGTVVEVCPGGMLRLRTDGRALRGAFAAGVPARGRLDLATDPFGDLRPGGIDVGRAGSILVVGTRIDAEALTRARAMGVRGIVVAALPGKELRDFRASERRQRAALHPSAPFGVLALEGAIRRPAPSPVMALLERLAGREVALLVDPPALVFEAADDDLPPIAADWVRVRSGPNAGTEGRLLGPAGLRRFARGVQLEAALVSIDGEPPVAIPLGDLERFA